MGDLPEIYRQRYRTHDFLKNWIVTLTVVGWKLAQGQAQPLSNVAEELALHLIIQDAIAHLDMIDSDDATKQPASPTRSCWIRTAELSARRAPAGHHVKNPRF